MTFSLKADLTLTSMKFELGNLECDWIITIAIIV